jgi:hypothetical protein
MLLSDPIIKWLLQGDVSIQYQTTRDLLKNDAKNLQKRIEKEGWGKEFLARRQPDGHWGRAFYQPKWTSSHYTILDLKNLNIARSQSAIKKSIQWIVESEKGDDGGINPGKTIDNSDVCINGMVLNYACYFKQEEKSLRSVVDFLLSQQMPDGGFNCHSNRKGAVHSSLHTTLSVLEGIHEYRSNGYSYRLDALKKAQQESEEFILIHRLFKSDKTGMIIHPNFLKLRYPPRWYYNILRALDYFRVASVPYDPRMQDALDFVMDKKNKNNTWDLAAKHPGDTHFEMEKAGQPSRWITLIALRVLQRYLDRNTYLNNTISTPTCMMKKSLMNNT